MKTPQNYLRSLALTFVLVLSFVPLSFAQDCPAPNKCVSGATVNAAADALCTRARAAETKTLTLISEKRDIEDRNTFCNGQLAQAQAALDKPTPAKMPRWFLVTLDVSAVLLTGAGVGIIGAGLPVEYGATIAALGLGSGVLRVVFEF